MAVDTSIYNNLLRPPKSVAEYDAERMQGQSNQLALRMGMQKADEYSRGLADTEAMRGVVSKFGADQTANYNALLGAGRLDEAQKYQKSNADISKTQGEAAKQKVELIDAKLKQSRSYLDSIRTPEQYIAWHEANHSDPILGPELAARGVTAAQARASIMEAIQRPGGFEELLKKSALGLEKFTELNKPTNITQNLGGTSQVSSIPGLGGAPTVLSSTPITQDANSIAANAQSDRNSRRTEASAAAGRAQSASQHAATLAQGSKPPAGYRNNPDGSMSAIPGGPADLKAGKEGAQRTNDAKDVLGLLDEVDAVLPKATGSYLGAAADQGARLFGASTKGAEATAQLKTLQGALISKMPKMTGPQSDKDVQLYREMAGQVGDETLPIAQRKSASKMIRKLNEKYAGVPEGSSTKAPGAFDDAEKERRYQEFKARQK